MSGPKTIALLDVVPWSIARICPLMSPPGRIYRVPLPVLVAIPKLNCDYFENRTNVKRSLSQQLRASGLHQFRLGIAADGPYRLDRTAIGDEGVDLAEMADAHRRRALELRG